MSPEHSTISLASAGGEVGEDLPRGTTLGRYMVLGCLGRGGMGVVYAAYDPELDRRVALKLLRPYQDEQIQSKGRSRLLREAQAMARVAHPNVIAVHDVGTLGDQVFVAMELVDGRTVSAWLKEKTRTSPEILEVFTQAGRGLAAAHEKGLVHRDFKPDNVLAGTDGRVRVLDFGLARAAEARPAGAEDAPVNDDGKAAAPNLLALQDGLTKTGALFGTPYYMAPEQFKQQPTDPRTDQFSFCVALYEALYGEHPFESKDMVALLAAVMAGAVRAEPPGRRLPARLRAALLRGLSVNKDDRFASMDALLAAIAPERPAARWWRPAAAAMLALGVLGVLGVREMRKGALKVCAGAEQKLGGVWDDARKNAMAAAFAASGTPYAEDARRGTTKALDDYTARWVTMHTDACMATRVRGEQSEELLDLRMDCLSHRLNELRALTALFTRADGKVVEQSVQAAASLGDLAECADAAALKAAVRPPKDAATRAKVDALRAHVDDARALELAGKYVEQLSVATSAAAEAVSLGYRPLEAEALWILGQAQLHAGSYKPAEQSFIDATVAAEAGRHDEVATRAFIGLIYTRRRLNAYDRARESGRYAGALLERLQGNVGLSALLEIALGQLAVAEGHYDDAFTHCQRALSSQQATLGAEHPEVADSWSFLGGVLFSQGKLKDASQAHRRALAIKEKALGPDHPAVAKFLISLANTLEQQGEYKEALEVTRRALAIKEKALGADHPEVAGALLNVGNILDDTGDLDGALVLYQRALAIRERRLGAETEAVSDVLNNIGATLSVQRKFPESLDYMRRSLAIREKLLGPEHPEVAISLANIGEILNELGRHREALASYEHALAVAEKALGKEHPYIGDALKGMGIAYLGLHQAKQACAPLESALAMKEKLGESKTQIGDASFHLARALWEAGGDRARAASLARRAQAYVGEQAERNKGELAKIDAWLATHGGQKVP